MTPTTRHNPIAVLNPISETDDVHEVSQETWAGLAQAIVATPPRPQRGSRRRESGLRARRPALRLAVAMAAATAVVAGATGVLSDQGPTGAAPADAAILRGANAALHPTGAIVVETESFVSKDAPGAYPCPAGFSAPASGAGSPRPRRGAARRMSSSWTWTRAPLLAFRAVGSTATMSSMTRPATSSTFPATMGLTSLRELHPARMSTPSPSSVTMLFFRLPDSPMGTDTPPPPLTITAAQARELRDGSAEVWVLPNAKHQNRMSIHPAFRVPTESARRA